MVARATHPLAGVQAHVDGSLEEDVVTLRELEAAENSRNTMYSLKKIELKIQTNSKLNNARR